MMIRRYAARSVAALVLLLCVACGGETAPTPTAMPLVPTAAPTALPTPTVAPTAIPPTRVPQPTQAIDTPTGGLVVAGYVTTTLTLTAQEIAAFPPVDVPSDVTGGEELRGPRLDDILQRAGVQPDAREVVFSTADGTTLVRPLEEVQGRFDLLLAIGTDGQLRLVDPRQDQPIALENVVRIEVR